MSEWLVLAAITLVALSGVPGLFRRRDGRAGEWTAAALVVTAGALGLASGIASLMGWSAELAAPWPVPGGRFVVRVDALSALFVMQISLIAALGAIYGLEYWAQGHHRQNGRRLRLFYGLLAAGLLLQVVARNALLFLAGWEIMALSSFMLIMTEDEQPAVRAVSYVYAVATRLGTLCLFAMFALLAADGDTLDFDAWPAVLASPLGGAIFLLGLVGFGLKAGIMPLHIWLPGAHASTPSHVSALMSGVLIKMGIYGLVRLTAMTAQPALWWGYTLLALGVVSGVLGVGFAIAQHDLKRLLAYHSVENIGIILMGLGVAVLGRASGNDVLVVLGLAGALLHTWNHGLFKALLFLSAGSVLHATGTRTIDRLGGLWRRAPRTALAFLVGAVAICGLPPLNGMVSELFIYLGLFRAGLAGDDHFWLAVALAAPALATVGALALACFVKVFGAVFLGEPRSAVATSAHDPGGRMLVPMALLCALCLAIGLGAPLVAPILDRAVSAWRGTPASVRLAEVAPLGMMTVSSAALLAAIVLVAIWITRRVRPATRELGTWDCGYAAPSPRMQYTASSFAENIVRLLGWALRPETHAPHLEGTFPGRSTFESHTPDLVLDRGVRPLFSLVARLLGRLKPIQQGSVHIYLLYILGTLVVLLLWG